MQTLHNFPKILKFWLKLLLEIIVTLLFTTFTILTHVNSFLLRIGRQIAWIAICLMVLVILLQVFFRYILNAALPWPDEVARFLMLWMTGLIAPSAYRWGGFVSIGMLSNALPKMVGKFLTLVLLSISLFILLIGFKLGLQHVKVGWIFQSSSIKIPFNLIGGKPEAIKLAWMYMSLPVGILLLILVNCELIMRNILFICNDQTKLPVDPDQARLEE